MLSITNISPGPAVWLNFTIPFQISPIHTKWGVEMPKDMQISHVAPPSTSKGGDLPNAAEFFLFPPDCRLWQEPAKIITRGDMSTLLLETENVHCHCFREIIITFQRSVLWCLLHAFPNPSSFPDVRRFYSVHQVVLIGKSERTMLVLHNHGSLRFFQSAL